MILYQAGQRVEKAVEEQPFLCLCLGGEQLPETLPSPWLTLALPYAPNDKCTPSTPESSNPAVCLTVALQDRYLSIAGLPGENGTPEKLRRLLDYAAQTPEAHPMDWLRELFLCLLDGEPAFLAETERHITALEEAATRGKLPGSHAILHARRQLMARKRYYELLTDALEDARAEPRLGEHAVRLAVPLRRVERLAREAQTLRDYVTQAREAYQNQLDIDQNKIMKLFTVIAAIFMPLTLIVGWYGMNLPMPETRSVFSYPVVIGVSAAVVVGCVVYFKKHDWF